MPIKIQNELLEDLKRFGLNPQDWTFYSTKSRTVQIQNKQDPDFQFRGQIKMEKERIIWKEMELHSL